MYVSLWSRDSLIVRGGFQGKPELRTPEAGVHAWLRLTQCYHTQATGYSTRYEASFSLALPHKHYTQGPWAQASWRGFVHTLHISISEAFDLLEAVLVP